MRAAAARSWAYYYSCSCVSWKWNSTFVDSVGCGGTFAFFHQQSRSRQQVQQERYDSLQNDYRESRADDLPAERQRSKIGNENWRKKVVIDTRECEESELTTENCFHVASNTTTRSCRHVITFLPRSNTAHIFMQQKSKIVQRWRWRRASERKSLTHVPLTRNARKSKLDSQSYDLIIQNCCAMAHKTRVRVDERLKIMTNSNAISDIDLKLRYTKKMWVIYTHKKSRVHYYHDYCCYIAEVYWTVCSVD